MSKNKLSELDLKKIPKAKAWDILRRELGEELGYLVYAGSHTNVANLAVAKFVYDQLAGRDRWWRDRIRRVVKDYETDASNLFTDRAIMSEDVERLL